MDHWQIIKWPVLPSVSLRLCSNMTRAKEFDLHVEDARSIPFKLQRTLLLYFAWFACLLLY